MPKFTVRIGGNVSASFLLDEDDIFIGRVAAINDICITDPSVSRQHAQIRKREEGFSIHDLKSLNGVHLNGKKVEEGRLTHGDVIRLGDVEITFETDTSSYSGEEEITKVSTK